MYAVDPGRGLGSGRGEGGAHVYLAVTAKPSPDWLLTHGNNSSKLLGAYKLWVDGQPLGVGPGRKIGGSVLVDTYNLTTIFESKRRRTGTGNNNDDDAGSERNSISSNNIDLEEEEEEEPSVVIAIETYYAQSLSLIHI